MIVTFGATQAPRRTAFGSAYRIPAVRHKPGIVTGMASSADIEALAAQIARLFEPEKIILFGSYAYGSPDEGSDVDLLVVGAFEGRSIDRALEIWSAVRA